MIMLSADTRAPLTDPQNIHRAEIVLMQLAAGLLGHVLLLTDDESVPLKRRRRIDTRVGGWLKTLVECELGELPERMKRVAEWFQQPKPTRFIGLFGLWFVSLDGRNQMGISGDERSTVTREGETQFSNDVVLQLTQGKSRGKELMKQCLEAADLLFNNDLFDYGYCCISAEYDSNNLDTSDGVCAIGLDVSRHLPGLYWGNYFGAYLCDVLGKELLLRVPGFECKQSGSGVFIHHPMYPDQWPSPDYRAAVTKAIEYIGTDVIFQKGKDRDEKRLRTLF